MREVDHHVTDLRDMIARAGLAGRAIVEFEHETAVAPPDHELDDPAARELAERFVAARGYCTASPGSWLAIDLPRAEDVLASLLAFDLAYEQRVCDDVTASRIARAFVECFPAECRAFTNAELIAEALPRLEVRSPHFVAHDWDRPDVQRQYLRPCGYTRAVLGATFDAGVLVVSSRRVGMLWLADED